MSFARLAAIFLLFAVLAQGLTFVGNPESPAYERLRGAGGPLDFAVIGDSRAHTGISPAILQREFSSRGLPVLRGLNFAVDGTDVLHHYSFAANGLLEGKARPRVILWTPNPLQFSEGRTSNRLEQLKASDILPFRHAGAPFETVLDLVTMSFFKPWKYRPLFATVVSDYTERAGKRTIPFQKKIMRLDYEPETLSRKYIALPDGQEPFVVLDWKDRFERGGKVYLQDYERLRLSDWHFEVARLLARKAREAGVLLVMIEAPLSPWFREHVASGAKHREWRRRMERIAEQESALFLNDSAAVQGDDRAFGDPGHMPRPTADRYSVGLAARLSKDPRVVRALKGEL